MWISIRHKKGTGHSSCVSKYTVSASKKYPTADGQSFSAAMTPSTIDTTINKNQDPYPSLDGNICISIKPASIIYFSGASTDDTTGATTSTPQKFTPLVGDYAVFSDSVNSVIRSVTVATSEKSRSI